MVVNEDILVRSGALDGNIALDNGAGVASAPVRIGALATEALAWVDRGKILEVGAVTVTVTLPPLASVANGAFYTIRNTGSAPVPINRSAADTIDGATTTKVLAGESVDVIAYVGGTSWRVIRAAAPKPSPSIYVSSKIGLKTTLAYRDLAAPVGTTYAWMTPAGVTLNSTVANTAIYTATSPGNYLFTVTATDPFGSTTSTTLALSLARIIEVNNADATVNDFFTSLSSALAWVAANGAPSATARWLIRCFGRFTELATVNALSYVDVYFENGAGLTTAASPALQINVIETCWSAANNGQTHVTATAANGNGLLMLGAIDYSTVHVRGLKVVAPLNSAALSGVAAASGVMLIEDCVFGNVNTANASRGLAMGNSSTAGLVIIVRRCVGNGGGIGISLSNAISTTVANIRLEACTAIQGGASTTEDRGALLCTGGRVIIKDCVGIGDFPLGFGLALDGGATPNVAPLVIGGYFYGGMGGVGLGGIGTVGLDLANTIIVGATAHGPTNAVASKSGLAVAGLRMQNCNLIGALGANITLAASTLAGNNVIV